MGDGGEGLVFRAFGQFGDEEREVALKMHTSLTLDDFDRFSLRSEALSEIDHPNVMHVIEVFLGSGLIDRDESPDEAFNVMYTAADWIPGLSLPVCAGSDRSSLWVTLGNRDRTRYVLSSRISGPGFSRWHHPSRHQALERAYHTNETGCVDRLRHCSTTPAG